MLWLFLLLAKMKKIQSKIKALECHKIICQFFSADNSIVSGEILPKFELIQAFMHVITGKNKED